MAFVFCFCFAIGKLPLTGEDARVTAGLRSQTGVVSAGHFPDLAGLLPNQRLHREGVSPGTQTLHLERAGRSPRDSAYPRELLESQLIQHRYGEGRRPDGSSQEPLCALGRSVTLRN